MDIKIRHPHANNIVSSKIFFKKLTARKLLNPETFFVVVVSILRRLMKIELPLIFQAFKLRLANAAKKPPIYHGYEQKRYVSNVEEAVGSLQAKRQRQTADNPVLSTVHLKENALLLYEEKGFELHVDTPPPDPPICLPEYRSPSVDTPPPRSPNLPSGVQISKLRLC